MVIGVEDGGLLVVGDVTASVGVGLPVGCTVLVLLVVLASVKMYKYVLYRAAILQRLYSRVASLPVAYFLVSCVHYNKYRLVRYVPLKVNIFLYNVKDLYVITGHSMLK